MVKNDEKEFEASKIECNRIKKLPDEELIEEFEQMVRKGAGEQYLPVIWMRREIIKRMNSGELV